MGPLEGPDARFESGREYFIYLSAYLWSMSDRVNL